LRIEQRNNEDRFKWKLTFFYLLIDTINEILEKIQVLNLLNK